MSWFSRLLFPPRCAACGKLLAPDEAQSRLCPVCEAKWSRELLLQCPDCFCEYYNCHCMTPLLKRAGCEGLIKLFPYAQGERTRVSRSVILRMKKHPRAQGFALCAEELAASIRLLLDEEGLQHPVLVYLPRSRRSVREYGFDQAKCLARELSRITGLECLDALKRHTDGKKQKGLTQKERIKNTKDAFRLINEVTGLDVLLVDDVVTTGAGAAAATRLLHKGQATSVYALAVACTEKERKTKKTLFGKGIAF